MSGVTTVEKTVTQDGRTVKLYVMTPQQQGARQARHFVFRSWRSLDRRQLREPPTPTARPRRWLRSRIGVFVEYTPLPAPRRPNPTGNRAPRGRTIVKHGMGSGKGRAIEPPSPIVISKTPAWFLLSLRSQRNAALRFEIQPRPRIGKSCQGLTRTPAHAMRSGRHLSHLLDPLR